MTDSSVVLQHGALRLALRPDCGGAITGLWLDDLPVLRSCEPHRSAASSADLRVPESVEMGCGKVGLVYPWPMTKRDRLSGSA